MRGSLSNLKKISPHRKFVVTRRSPVGNMSVVTLMRTDTTLDHSQKAEKVCSASLACPLSPQKAELAIGISLGAPRNYPEEKERKGKPCTTKMCVCEGSSNTSVLLNTNIVTPKKEHGNLVAVGPKPA